MGLSSNVLWHQTKKEGFFKILSCKKMLYSYSLEKSLPLRNDQGIAYPMISLSDIPMCEMPNNKWTYGDYAIGFTREWSIRNGFTPVWYCEPNSVVYRLLHQLAIETLDKNDKNRFGNYMYLFSNVKFIESKLKTSRRTYENYRFYDEREYRLVAQKPELDKHQYSPILIGGNYEKYKKEHNDKSLLEIGVDFTFKDIKYLIVKSEQNRTEVEEILKKDKDERHIHIFTKKEILEEFIGIEHNIEKKEAK